MRYFLFLMLAAACFQSTTAQSRTNADIQKQISSIRGGGIELEFDSGSNTTKIKAVSENFSDAEVRQAGVKAMNFAAGVIYAGDELEHSPDPMMFSFWILSGKPKFGQDHSLKIVVDSETFSIDNTRYVARQRDGMEYLNFDLTRDELSKMAKHSNVKALLGGRVFTMTGSQLNLLADLYLITEVPEKP